MRQKGKRMVNHVEQVVGERAKAGECKGAADDAQQRPARSWGLHWARRGGRMKDQHQRWCRCPCPEMGGGGGARRSSD